jgi:hypothetical protein
VTSGQKVDAFDEETRANSLCFVDRASRYVREMKPTLCTIYLQFIQQLYLYMFRAC